MNSAKTAAIEQVQQRGLQGFIKYIGLPNFIGMLCILAFISVLGYSAGNSYTTRTRQEAIKHQDSLEIIKAVYADGMEVSIRTTTYLASGTSPVHNTVQDTYMYGSKLTESPAFSINFWDSTHACASYNSETARRKSDTVIVTKCYGSVSFSKNLDTWRRQ
jgi:hypothetical protein